MDEQVTEIISQVLPPWGVSLRLLMILLVAALVRLRTGSPDRHPRRGVGLVLLARIAPAATVLLLTALAVKLGSPWGFDLSPDVTRQHTAWNLYWIAVLVIALIDGAVDVFHRKRGSRHPIPPLLRRGLLLAIYATAALGILRYYLDADITPLLATSAIVTMVVGLALQGVLGNLLSGMSLSLVRSVEVGDLIGVRDVEGVVIRTNWRETILRTRDDDYVHVPNNVLAADLVSNFSKPASLHRHHIDVGASYSDAPAEVIAELVGAAHEAKSTLDRPAPSAIVTGYLDFGINYRVYFYSENYWQKRAVEGEVARHIWYRFRRKGIEIPFPMSDQLLNDFMAVVYNQ
ncbi:mechanosensitive ion channel family protein, partial [bacterium]|nr:mechanosensitive ion channel family protein [bacterium]